MALGNIAPIGGVQPGSTFEPPVRFSNQGSKALEKVWLRYTVTTSCPSIPAAWPAWLAPVNHARIVNRGVYA